MPVAHVHVRTWGDSTATHALDFATRITPAEIVVPLLPVVLPVIAHLISVPNIAVIVPISTSIVVVVVGAPGIT